MGTWEASQKSGTWLVVFQIGKVFGSNALYKATTFLKQAIIATLTLLWPTEGEIVHTAAQKTHEVQHFLYV